MGQTKTAELAIWDYWGVLRRSCGRGERSPKVTRSGKRTRQYPCSVHGNPNAYLHVYAFTLDKLYVAYLYKRDSSVS